MECPSWINLTKYNNTSLNMTTPIPHAYTSLPFKDISISHVPASSPSATKVVVLALNRPDKYNAVTGNMMDEMEAAYKLFEKDERVRAIVLTGTGKAFCAGADLEVGFSGLLKDKQDEASMRAYRDRQVNPIRGGCTRRPN